MSAQGQELPSIEGIQAVFFDAMLAGYAGSAAPSEHGNFPGSKILEYSAGDFRVIDMWYATKLGGSAPGQTVIWYKGRPVWWMQYSGWYQKRAIPFLKLALKRAYEERTFFGGRGCDGFRDPDNPDLVYMNSVKTSGNFTRFVGKEWICGESGRHKLGQHEFCGGLFFNPADR